MELRNFKWRELIGGYGGALAAGEVILLLAGHGARMAPGPKILTTAATVLGDIALVAVTAFFIIIKLTLLARLVKPLARRGQNLVEPFVIAPFLAANAALWARAHILVGYPATHVAKLLAYAAAGAAAVAASFLLAALRRRFVTKPVALVLGGITLAVAAMLFLWPSARARRAPVAAGPDVVFISLDTVRADHLGCYGYNKDTSPRLDAFAREAVVFDNAGCAEPSTNPSHASMFTGLYPGVHGVDSNFRPFARGGPLLAEALAAYGYDTAAVVGGFPLDRRLADLSGGFALYDDYINRWSYLRHMTLYRVAAVVAKSLFGDLRDGRDVTAAATAVWRKKRKRPLFLFVHYFDPHSPYRYHGRAEAFYRGRQAVVFAADWGQLNRKWNRYKPKTPRPAYADAVEALYDDEIHYTDAAVGELLANLRRSGRWGRTMIVIASDHGESFGEHGVKYHGDSLYDAETRVALLIKPAGRAAARRENRQVETLAIPYTILAAVGAPRGDWSGARVDLLNLPPNYAGAAYARTNTKAAADPRLGRDYALRTTTTKVVFNVDDGLYTTFDLQADPAEVDGRPGADAPSRKSLAGHIKTAGRTGASGKVDRDATAVLKSLGYVE